MDLERLVKNWWMMAGRGILAIVFGAAMVLWRAPVFDAVIISFGTYAILDGILAIAAALRAAGSRTIGWPMALEGIVSVFLGSLAFAWPLFGARAVDTLAVWGLLTGILELVAAMGLPRRVAAHWLVGTAGVSSIFLAIVLLALPRAGSDRVALSLGLYAIVFGVVVLLAAVRFKRAAGHDDARGARRPSGPVLVTKSNLENQ
jgi:uncharacterized membrane protein HdeD (DUF308 family)